VRRPAGDDGNAMLEFTYLAVLLMVPLIYILTTTFQVQRAAFGVTEAARQAGRAYATADDDTSGRARADAAARRADLMLAVGTTLGVYPIANVVPLAKAHGAPVVIVNGGPTEMDDLADVRLEGSISDLLPALVGP